eukprot:SAG11_NODE_2928_length_2831_cov_24.172767_3_plen_159_part_00
MAYLWVCARGFAQGFRKLLAGPGWTKVVFFLGKPESRSAESGQKNTWARPLKRLATAAGNLNKECTFAVIDSEELATKLGYRTPSIVLFRDNGNGVNVTFPLEEEFTANKQEWPSKDVDRQWIQSLLLWVQMQSFPPIGNYSALQAKVGANYGSGVNA